MPQSSRRYVPLDAPQDLEQLAEWVSRELHNISDLTQLLYDGFAEKTFVEPAKLREGMIRFADGTEWDPGSGEGLYIYRSAAWHLLG